MRTLLATLGVLALGAPVWAAGIDGKWEATQETPRGEMTLVFDLKADGGALTGVVSNDFMGESEISDGKIDGDAVSFKQIMERGDRKITFVYEGKLSGDELTLTRTVEGRGPGGKGDRPGPGAGPGGPGGKGGGPGGGRGGMGGPQTLTAKRIQ